MSPETSESKALSPQGMAVALLKTIALWLAWATLLVLYRAVAALAWWAQPPAGGPGWRVTVTNVLNQAGETLATWQDQMVRPSWPEPVRTEVAIAWQFTRERVAPKVDGAAQQVVTALDGPAATVWTKTIALPPVQTNWEKARGSAWGKRIATIWSAVQHRLDETAGTWEWATPYRAKRAGTIALLLILWLGLSLVKGSLGGRKAAAIAQKPAPTVQVNAPIAKAPAIPVSDALVTDIQAQVEEVTQRYGSGLVEALQTNFRSGRLVVQLSESWHELSTENQEKIVDDLYARANRLKFQKLFVIDGNRQLIARSPVVGDRPVILQR
ncbi:MAG TPA: hypothetical protein DCQ32_09205 [Cyanobacteria bacterium UBA8156]|nr:hypothetical protein [Cyanobacteria bacterium UBA8156]